MPSIYDTYLCREPAGDIAMLTQNGPDEYTALLRTLQRSADYFAERDYTHAVERLQFEMARVHMQHGQWERAMRVLLPLWQTLSWRRSGWWQMLEETDLALSECARQVKDYETLICVEWELSNSSLTPRQDGKRNTLKIIEDVDTRPKAIIRAENILSCVSATFGFSSGQGYVGEPLSSQLILRSQSHKTAAPIVILKIKIAFEGGLKDLVVEHDGSKRSEASTTDGLVHFQSIHLQRQHANVVTGSLGLVTQGKMPLVGSANLKLATSERKCLSFDHVPRDAGDVEVTSITLYMREDAYDLEITITEDDQLNQEVSWIPSISGLAPKPLKPGRSNVVKILPKPPKLNVELPGLLPTYFTDEMVALELLITNEEEDEVDVTLDVRMIGPPGQRPDMKWASTEEDVGAFGTSTHNDDPLEVKSDRLPSKHIGSLAKSAIERKTVDIHTSSEGAEYLLEIKASYYLLSDPETPIVKSFSANLLVVLPFEASYTFSPLLSPEPWPSYFDLDEPLSTDTTDEKSASGEKAASGLTQRWYLTSRIASLADVPLTIDAVKPRVLAVHENATCKISPAAESSPSLSSISPNDLQERAFIIEAQKIELDDRQSAFLNLQLEIPWRRIGSLGPANVTRLAVSELVIPFGEPRVLASARNGESPPGVIHLDYIIENPSMYTLNFNLTMETSEEFAFSGLKNVSVQLVPLSRHTTRYNLMPLVKGVWITPQFRVFDTHFRKTLKVNATEGMRTESKGVQIWANTDD